MSVLYQDRINFGSDDPETIQLYGFGCPEDMVVFDSMPAHGKTHQFDMSFLNMNVPTNNMTNYIPSTYETSDENQQELAALPNSYAGHVNGSNYGQSSVYDFSTPQNHAYAPAAICPSMPASAQEQYQTTAPIPTIIQSNKRRRSSDDSLVIMAPVTKRVHRPVEEEIDFHDSKSEPSPYSLIPTPTTVPSYASFYAPVSPSHQHTLSNVSAYSVPAATPYTPTVSPAFTVANTEHSPRAPATPAPRPSSTTSNPKLVRTSTIPNHSSPAIHQSANFGGHVAAFNPYTMFSPDSKARLHIEGNLDDVANEWSEEELEAERKIVVFEREQKGNDIHATFSVVAQTEWKNHPRTVNCIWWKEKKEAYVTSVDTILLLESLVAARFTVEEKNRIRRNLEGFKPLTVSKAKADSEEFFKVIMGFPNPKPRNIEKDVKVFPWKVLSIALQKIIGKYSASYASTAAVTGGPQKIYRPLDYMVSEPHYLISPGQEYTASMGHMVGYPPPQQHGPGRMSAPATPIPTIHYMSQMGDINGNYAYPTTVPSQQFQPQSYGHQQVMPYEYSSYRQHHAYPTQAQHSAPPMAAYTRDMIETADFRYLGAGNGVQYQ